MLNNGGDAGTPLYFRRLAGSPYPTPRLLWHPVVHHTFRERCSFFLISAPDLSRDVSLSSQVREILREVDIDSYSLYILYGTFDVLLRVWATESATIRLLRAFEGIAPDAFYHLDCQTIEHTFWATVALDEFEVTTRKDIIADVIRHEAAADWPQPATDNELPPSLAELVEEQLAYDTSREVPAIREEGQNFTLKCFSLLQRRRGLASTAEEKQELRALREALRECTASLVSIYILRNNTGYLVECFVPDFDSIRSSFSPLYEFCFENRFRPQTFPIPNVAEAVEADLVDAAVRDDSLPTEEAVRVLTARGVPNARSYLGSLTPGNRDAFLKFLKTYTRAFYDDPISYDVAALLEGIALSDRRAIMRALTFVPDTEDILHHVVWTIMSDTVPNWERFVREVIDSQQLDVSIADTSDATVDTPFDSWMLRDTSLLVGKLCSSYPAFRDRWYELLSPDWRQDLETVRQLRNRLAHGSFRAVIDADGEEVSKFLTAAAVFGRLDKFARDSQNRNGKGPRL